MRLLQGWEFKFAPKAICISKIHSSFSVLPFLSINQKYINIKPAVRIRNVGWEYLSLRPFNRDILFKKRLKIFGKLFA